MHDGSSVRLRAADVFGRESSGGAIVAVVEIDESSTANLLAETLARAGIDGLEITIRTESALESVARATEADALPVGAGTVLSSQLVDQAVDAGAHFLVSPCFDVDVSNRAAERETPLVPGAVTPTEVMRARLVGHREVKVFPAATFGGLGLITSLSAVFPDVQFMPTGGITHESALEYLANRAVMAVGGTWIAPRTLIAAEDWTEIGRRARAVVDARRASGV